MFARDNEYVRVHSIIGPLVEKIDAAREMRTWIGERWSR